MTGAVNHGGREGFSMLEMIVAVALLSIGIVAVLHIFSSSLLAARTAEDYSRAALLAHRVAVELERDPELAEGSITGDFGEQDPGYSWNAEVTRDDDNNLYRASIRIFREEGRAGQAFEMTACFGREQSGATAGEEEAPPEEEEDAG